MPSTFCTRYSKGSAGKCLAISWITSAKNACRLCFSKYSAISSLLGSAPPLSRPKDREVCGSGELAEGAPILSTVLPPSFGGGSVVIALDGHVSVHSQDLGCEPWLLAVGLCAAAAACEQDPGVFLLAVECVSLVRAAGLISGGSGSAGLVGTMTRAVELVLWCELSWVSLLLVGMPAGGAVIEGEPWREPSSSSAADDARTMLGPLLRLLRCCDCNAPSGTCDVSPPGRSCKSKLEYARCWLPAIAPQPMLPFKAAAPAMPLALHWWLRQQIPSPCADATAEGQTLKCSPSLWRHYLHAAVPS
mmetsp:Transcript_31910/g.74666  ORF Transcript_31910/g.74666 Transcript_31910/m.74666 type:complete len:304 (+) Transcript_31910:2050-2961(+)